MDAIFVNLELVKDEVFPSQIKQIPLKRNEDLVTLQTSTGLRVNRILIQGEAGSGKSTLLDNIAYKWALQLESTDPSQSSDSPLSQFDLVFLIRVHEIFDENNTLEEIIFDQILEEGPNISQTGLKSYFKLDMQKCLILVDGLDEDSAGILNSRTAEMSRLLYNKMYRKSCVIASTRPDILKNMGRNERIFTQVKLSGFSEENIEEYVRKYFTENEVYHTNLIKQLKEQPHVWNLAGTPLLLLFFCLLWNDPIEAKKSLPDTETKLYQETITCLWKRYHYEKQDLSIEDVGNEECQLQLTKFLENLGQVTLKGLIDQITEEVTLKAPQDQSITEKVFFKGLKDQRREEVHWQELIDWGNKIRLIKQSKVKVLFQDSNFDEMILSLALRVGILSRVRSRSKLHVNSCVKFLHLSFQDFCSAVYLSNLQHVDNETCKEYVGKLVHEIQTVSSWTYSRCSEVLNFMAGCNSETMMLIMSQFVHAKDTSKSATDQGRLQGHPEMEASSASTSTRKTIEPRESSFGPEHLTISFLFQLVLEAQLTYEDCHMLNNILSGSNLPLRLSWKLGQTEKHVQYHLNLLKSLPTSNNGLFFSTLSSILLCDPVEFPEFYMLVVSMLRYTKQLLCYFELNFKFLLKPFEVSNLSLLFEAFANLKHLKHLTLHRDLENVGYPYNVDITHSLYKIHNLKLKKINFTMITVTALSLANFLSSNTSLKWLNITCVIHYNTSSTYIMRAISRIQTLETLTLSGVVIESAVKFLKPVIPRLQKLTIFGPESLGVWDLHELASHLQMANTMIRLDLSHNILGTAAGNLAHQLQHMVSLERLSLNDNDLEDSDVRLLAEGIKMMSSSLRQLDLLENPNIGLEGREELQNVCNLPQFQDLYIDIDPISTTNPSMQEKQWNLEQQTPVTPDCCSCMSQLYSSVACKNSKLISSTKSSHRMIEMLYKIGIQVDDKDVADSRASSSKQTTSMKKDGKHKQKSKTNKPAGFSMPSKLGQSSAMAALGTSPAKLASNKRKTSTEGSRLSAVKRFRQEPPLSEEEEGIQSSFLPNCCCCMSQIYNDLSCKLSSTKTFSIAKDVQNDN